jgi:formylmethanofuran dehydrogenase subunit E
MTRCRSDIPMITKTCNWCGAEKPLTDFYKSKGRMCKICYCATERQRRRDNPAVREYDRQRAKLPHRKENTRRVGKAFRANNPEKYVAQNAVNNAIRDRRLSRGTHCQQCGSEQWLHAHHDDYSKPLEVRWLCAMCHHRHHAEERRNG